MPCPASLAGVHAGLTLPIAVTTAAASGMCNTPFMSYITGGDIYGSPPALRLAGLARGSSRLLAVRPTPSCNWLL